MREDCFLLMGSNKFSPNILASVNCIVGWKIFQAAMRALCLTFFIFLVAPWLSSCASELETLTYSQSEEFRKSVIENIQPFRISGIESSGEWIENRHQTLSLAGFAISGSQMKEVGVIRQGIVYLPETVEGVTVYHVVPFLIDDNFMFDIRNNRRTDGIDDSLLIDASKGDPFVLDIQSTFSQGNQLIRIDFSTHDGWIRADRIAEYENLAYVRSEMSQALFIPSVEIQQEDAKEVSDNSLFWLDISEGEIIEVRGILDSNQEHIMIPSKLGTAAMYHFVKVCGLEESDVLPLEKGAISLTLLDGRLIYAASPN